jgi:hypothetical protein
LRILLSISIFDGLPQQGHAVRGVGVHGLDPIAQQTKQWFRFDERGQSSPRPTDELLRPLPV